MRISTHKTRFSTALLLCFLLFFEIYEDKKSARKRKIRHFGTLFLRKEHVWFFNYLMEIIVGPLYLNLKKSTTFGLNLIVSIDIKKTDKPTLKDFEKAKVFLIGIT